MYFTTFNHYDDDDNIDIYKENDVFDLCLICWDNNNNICKMKALLYSSIYYTSCTCNGNFHHTCLMKWINKTNSCPICRIKLKNRINYNENIPLTFNILKYLKLFKYICIILFIRMLYDIMFELQYTVHKKLQNDS